MTNFVRKSSLLLIASILPCSTVASELQYASIYDSSLAAGKAAARSRRYNEAHRHFDTALIEAEKELGENNKEAELIFALEAKADSYDKQSKFERADPLKLRALSIAEHYYGPDSPLLATRISWDANRFLKLGKYDKAEDLFRRALVIREKLFQRRAELAWDLTGLAKSLEGQKRYLEAEELYVRCLKLYFPLAGGLFIRLRNLGECYLAQGRIKEAQPFLERANELERQDRNLSRAVKIAELAHRECGKKNYKESENLFKRALAIVDQYSEPFPEKYRILTMYADMQDKVGRHSEANHLKVRANEIDDACNRKEKMETGLVLQ